MACLITMDPVPPHLAPKKGHGLLSVIAYAMCVCAILLLTWLSPLPQAPVAVWVAPGHKAAFDVVEASGGHMLSISNLPNIVIAQSEDPQFISRLYTHGALFVFNPQFLTGCQTKA